MFGHPELWSEIGYHVKSGELQEGSNVVLYRSSDSSPGFLEEHSPIDDIVQFVQFESQDSQSEWLINQIKSNLEKEELRHDDIVVINPDPFTTREQSGPIRRRLLELGISSHLAGVDTSPDVFFQSDVASVTFTGIYRAKGNEAGMVYVINAQDCHSAAWNLASIRNRLFTAITRSKAWVRVLGVGDGMKELIEEFNRLKQRNFELHFQYPTEEQRKQLMIVHRDITSEERKRVKSREKDLLELVADLESGKLHLEDIDEKVLARVKEHLKGKR